MPAQVWTAEEVVTLLSAWGDDGIQKKLDGATRNERCMLKLRRGYWKQVDTIVLLCTVAKKLKAK